MAAIAEALARLSRGDGIVLDGFLTKQTAHAAAVDRLARRDALGRSAGRALRDNRAVDTVTLKEEALAARSFVSEDAVSFVATDLLWLDDTSLLDVPLLERRRLLGVGRRRIGRRPASARSSARRSIRGSPRGARMGFAGPDLQGRQQPLPAGRAEPRLGHHAGCRAAEGGTVGPCPRPR